MNLRQGNKTGLSGNYQATIVACFLGYIVQAICNNFVPLLFVFMENIYGISLGKITFLTTFNFGLQLVIDAVSAGFIDRIGYRASMILAHALSAAGLILLAVLPNVMDPFTGVFICVLIYAVGGGLLEVLVSPIVEACPTDNKETAMSLLHSFYCWGHVGVVLITTLFFHFIGIRHWQVLSVLWAIVPLANLFLFAKVPINTLIEEGETGLKLAELAKFRLFWVLMLMMVCAGASEQAVSQWASAYAEEGLHVSKTIGDLAGPMFFAVMMGSSRAIFGKFGERMNLERFMTFSAVLCFASYLVIVFVPSPVIGLIGCGIAGFSVGIFWPGTFSMASAGIKGGGTLMFAMFALGGDIGCSLGPTVVGTVASMTGDNLKMGILAAIVFPVLMFAGIRWRRQALSRN